MRGSAILRAGEKVGVASARMGQSSAHRAAESEQEREHRLHLQRERGRERRASVTLAPEISHLSNHVAHRNRPHAQDLHLVSRMLAQALPHYALYIHVHVISLV